MATETGPDLSDARLAVEDLMDDSCRIVRYEDASVDTLDVVTGSLSVPAGDPVTVYDESSTGDGGRVLLGRCKASPMTESQPRLGSEGAVEILPRPYRFSVPWDAPEPKIGDLITILSSRRDPTLVGTEFIVKDVMRSTFLVGRRMIVERRQ